MRRAHSHWERGSLDETALESIAAESQGAQGRPFDDDATMLLIQSRLKATGWLTGVMRTSPTRP